MAHSGLGNTEDVEGGRDPAPENGAAMVGGPLGPLKTRETTVQDTNFIINIKKPQGIYGPAYASGEVEKELTFHFCVF